MFTWFKVSSRSRASDTSGTQRGTVRAAWVRSAMVALFIALAGSLVVATTADARIGGGGSFGSRGSRTFSVPPSTATAPRISPFDRAAAPYGGGYYNNGFGRTSGFFGGGFGRGLLGGFLGAGLFGLLFGHGFMGGLGGGMSLIGLILQLGLLYLAFRFVMGLFTNRRQPAYGGAGGAPFGAFGGSTTGGGWGGGVATTPISLATQDYEAFERRLAESQTAYSNGDVTTLRRIATPEMAARFENELRENERMGVVNRLSDVHLRQGDLSEAWRESGGDYATVAMRFSLVDATIDKASGRVVAGDPRAPQDVTEVWTFQRPSGSGPAAWTLSAIQQA